VLLVDEADFKSRNTVPFEGARRPANAAAEQAQQQQAKPEPVPQQPRQKTEAERAAEAQKPSAASLAKEMPELLAVPEPGRPPPKAAESKPQPEQRQPQPQHKHQQKQTASLNPSPKTSQDDLVFDGSASFSRPAGITRSGENDDFGRGVIRALRQTMPPPRGSRGRVTIRFLLSETGSLVEVRVVATNADPGLTQSVVFASKQSSFPIPPKGATIADRTFLVTYIYE
jgi:TonB family protein